MVETTCEPMLVVASERELPKAERVWGTGGWLVPEEREALDWLTLSRLLGWGVAVAPATTSGIQAMYSDCTRWVILACDPDSLTEEFVAFLASQLVTEPVLVVARAGGHNSALARIGGAARGTERIEGRFLRWTGPGPAGDWNCRHALDAWALDVSEGSSIWATLEGAPFVVARQVGRGVVATLGFHPSHARDSDGTATILLKHLIIWSSALPLAWLDLEGSFVLRMDDPGGAQNVHCREWSYPKLGEAEWAAIGSDLKQRKGRISIGYVSGWVDDGDVARGTLKVAGRTGDRVPGWVHPSPLVKYQDNAGHAPGTLHDYESEYRGIQALRNSGLGDVELHGYTHMHPDTTAWARAIDRYESVSWYRELGSTSKATIATRPSDEHPLVRGIASLCRFFSVYPTTLISPGDEWTNAVLERALDLGLYLVDSYYLAIRDDDRFCWTQHVCAPYIDKPDATWFASGLPVVGYLHDLEPALEGVGWLSKWLDRWQEAGAKRLMDFRELAAAVGRRLSLEERDGGLHLTVRDAGAPALVRPLPVTIRVPSGPLPPQVSVSQGDSQLSMEVYPLDHGLGRVIVPVSI